MPSAKSNPPAKERPTTKTQAGTGPSAWRLPSGKALGEFALQSGFVAPLLLDGIPFWRRATGAGWTSRGRTAAALASGGSHGWGR